MNSYMQFSLRQIVHLKKIIEFNAILDTASLQLAYYS